MTLSGGTLVILLGGNWQLGYANTRFLASLFLLWIPGTVGIGSPLWYWIGRPVWYRLEQPGGRLVRPFQDVRFLPGLAGAVLGGALIIPVTATSPFWEQLLIPFGLLLGLASPLWFWLLRPSVGQRVSAWLPGNPNDQTRKLLSMRVLPAIGALFVVSMVVTALIALPIVAIGDPVQENPRSVTITDTRTVTEVTELERGYTHGENSWRLLLVRVAVDNRGDAPQQLPGTSVGDISVIAPACRAQNFGEPANNCNQVYLDGNFTANGVEYANYDTRQESAAGIIEPGGRITGWLVFRIETQPDGATGGDAMVIVDDVGRWTLGNEYRESVAPS
ncbi:hypothetical protein [Halolamina sp. C58]|uniref:hypothetical protein n=1 Tax=Halolamina sp. C58 TaxID=3421640 RepID=UPI003EB81142